jgi:hypothetical protein
MPQRCRNLIPVTKGNLGNKKNPSESESQNRLQLSKKVKESFGSFGQSSDLLDDEPPATARPQDPDWVFFRGFGGKSPTDLVLTLIKKIHLKKTLPWFG